MDAKQIYELIHKAAEKKSIRTMLTAGVAAIEWAKELDLASDADVESFLSTYAHAMLMEYIGTDGNDEPGFGQPVLKKMSEWLYSFALGFRVQARF